MRFVKYLGVVRVGECFGGGVKIGEWLDVKKVAVCRKNGKKDSSCYLITRVIKLICDGSQVLPLHMGTW